MVNQTRQLPDEVLLLCPSCGSLSPYGTKNCDCGYRLKRSSAPYVIIAVVVIALLLVSVGWVSYFAGQQNAILSMQEMQQSLEEYVEPEATPSMQLEYVPPSPSPAPQLSLAELPPNGRIVYPNNMGYSEGGSLIIVANNNTHYYIKLRDAKTDKIVLSFFVQAGMSAEVTVPCGEYALSYACGEDWYGYTRLFGDTTSYCKADEVFDFVNYGQYTVELYERPGGNLSTEEIDPEDF